jgi:glyoxylase-like metal-dependent hydrolase (beta-lactamase superfamily II)
MASGIRVIALQTGTIRVPTRLLAGVEGHSMVRRKFDIVMDRKRTGFLPILAWLVEHPEGLFVVDTGDTARSAEPGYLPRWHPFFRRLAVVTVSPDEEIGPLLNARGIRPARDVTAVVMTHLHHDHAGGLAHFPHTRILVTRQNWALARSARGKIFGYVPQRFPRWFAPEAIEFTGPPLPGFSRSCALTSDGRLSLVETPGHTRGHVSLVVRDDDVSYFVSGDVTYSQELLVRGVVDGITYSIPTSLRSMRAVQAYARSQPTVLLPSHDPESMNRLANRDTIPGGATPVSASA